MLTLEGPEAGHIRNLIPPSSEAGHTTFAHGVLEGTMPGRVLTDDAGTAAIVASASGFFLAVGSPDDSFVETALLGLERVPTIEPPAIWATNEPWRRALSPLFRVSRQRDEFLPLEALAGPSPAIPEGLRVEQGTRALGVAYHASLVSEAAGQAEAPWLTGAWGGLDGFSEHSFGTGLMDGDRLIAICAACAVARSSGEPEAEIEIWTAPEARRRGLATIVAHAFMRQCHQMGMAAAWTCEAQNRPSRLLAERLGFRFLRRIEGFALDALVFR